MEPYVPYYQWPEYDLLNDLPEHLHRSLVGTNPVGKRWGLWPLYFEEYISDEEPVLLTNPNDPPRIVLWRRFASSDPVSGWRMPNLKPSWMEGYADVSPDYRRTWSKSARYDANKWERASAHLHTIEPVSFDEFSKAYLASSVGKKLEDSRLQVIKRKSLGVHANSVSFIAARHIESGEIVAGMGIITSESRKQSFYYCGFYRDSGATSNAMTGLIDHWFKTSLERGFTRLHFGQFWIPGESPERRGFSDFKAKFGIAYAQCQTPLWRFVWGRIF